MNIKTLALVASLFMPASAHAASNALPRSMIGTWCAVDGKEDTYYRTERGGDCPASDVKPWYITSTKHLAVSTFDCRVTKVNKRHVALLVNLDGVQSFHHVQVAIHGLFRG